MTPTAKPRERRRERKTVTFRRVAADGTVLRVNHAEMMVTLNERTGRYVLPVLMQEGTGTVTVWRAGDELIVDVKRQEDGD